MSEYDEPSEPTEAEEREHSMSQAVKSAPGITITGLTAEAVEIIVREAIENNYGLADRAQRYAEQQADKQIKNLISDEAKLLVTARINKILDEGWVKHDHFGNKAGELITVHSILAKELSQKSSDRYGEPEYTMIQRLAKKAASEVIDKAFAAELAEAKAAFRAQVDELLKGKLATSLKEALGLK